MSFNDVEDIIELLAHICTDADNNKKVGIINPVRFLLQTNYTTTHAEKTDANNMRTGIRRYSNKQFT